MPAEKAEAKQDAVWHLSELIAGQRGDHWQHRTKRSRETYARALIEHMHQVRAEE